MADSEKKELVSDKNKASHEDDDIEPIDQSSPLIKVSTPDDEDHNIQQVMEEEVSDSRCAQCCYIPKLILSKMDAIDKKLSSYIFKWSPGKFFDCLISIPCLAFSYFGFPVWIIIYIIIMQSYLYALCVLVSIVVTQIMKRAIKRPRPKLSELGERWFYLGFEDVSAEHSFPSGDTSQSAVFCVTLGYSIDHYYFLGLAFITPLVALGMIYIIICSIFPNQIHIYKQEEYILVDIILEIQLVEQSLVHWLDI